MGKFTVRWNSPGALEVTDPSVNISGAMFNFSGLGKHSNNKYKYFLSLSLFDNVVEQFSSWSMGSVGKLSVTLRKQWQRKWPRLLGNKKAKVNNMHVWMEMQEKLDSTLGGMSTASNSPVTCAAIDKLYCLATDTCKKLANCTQCPGQTMPDPTNHICAGVPSETPSVRFKDSDNDEGQIGGDVTVTRALNEFDITDYTVYFGTAEKTKLFVDGKAAFIGHVPATGVDREIRIPFNTPLPPGAAQILVFSRNQYGESETPGHVSFQDAVTPKGYPQAVSFYDEDGDKQEVSGTVAITPSEDDTHLSEYAVHWGKTHTKKIHGASFIHDVSRGSKPLSHFIPENTKIPDGAAYILVFAKNEFTENSRAASVRIVDNTKPCLKYGDADCPTQPSFSASDGTNLVIGQAKSEATVTHYKVYWGRGGCTNESQARIKNGLLKQTAVNESMSVSWRMADVPTGTTHMLVYSNNIHGESNFCVSVGYGFSKDTLKYRFSNNVDANNNINLNNNMGVNNNMDVTNKTEL